VTPKLAVFIVVPASGAFHWLEEKKAHLTVNILADKRQERMG
jgi:hypothetical protein